MNRSGSPDPPFGGVSTPTWAVIIAFGIYGMSATLVGTLMPTLISRFDTSLASGSWLYGIQNVAGLLALVAAGLLGELVAKHRLITVSYVLFAAVLLVVEELGSYPLFLSGMFVLGMAGRAFDTSANAHVADLGGAQRARSLSFMHAAFGVGATGGPLLASMAGVAAFRVVGAVAVLALAFHSTQRRSAGIPQGRVARLPRPATVLRWLGQRSLIPLYAVSFLHFGSMGVLLTWLPAFVKLDLMSNDAFAASSLSLFWAGVVVSRVGAGHMETSDRYRRFVGTGALFGGLVFVTGVLIGTALPMVIASAMLGVLTGFTIPLTVARACGARASSTATVSSAIFLTGFGAQIVLPWLVGVIADKSSLGVGLLIVPACHFAVAVLAVSIRADS